MFFFFFFKQKTAYEMVMSDWSSDVCSSDLRRAIGKAGDVHDAALALHDEVVAGAMRFGPRLAEARDRAVHEARIEAAQCLEAHAEPFHRAGAEVLDDDVALAREAPQNVQALAGLEVERDALLAAVDRHEVRGLARHKRRPFPRVVALAPLLDLDDLGAHVGQHHRAERSSEDACEIEHPDAVERLSSSHLRLP